LKYTLSIFITLFILSCKSTKPESESEYQNCVNTKTFERGIFYPLNTSESDIENSVNVFDSIKKFENYLENRKSLSGINKNDYLILITKLDVTDFLKKEFTEFNSDNYFIKNNLTTSFFREELLHLCFLKSFRKNQEYYQKQLSIYDKVFMNSYADSKILTELTKEIDFENNIQRLILTFLIYDNLYRKYEME
jgi:hypothetical protein